MPSTRSNRPPSSALACSLLCRSLARLRLGARLLARGTLGGGPRFGGFLLRRRLRRPETHDRFAGNRIRDAERRTELLEQRTHLIEHRDHLGPGVDDALEVPPLADEAEGLVAGLHQAAADETLEVRLHRLVGLHEPLLVSGPDLEAN